MNRSKFILGGIFSALSMVAAPVFAAPKTAIQAQAKIQFNVGSVEQGYNNQNYNDGRYDGRFNTQFDTYDRFGRKSSYDDRLEAEILDLVNQIRAREGISALRIDKRAMVSARRSSSEASREGGFFWISQTVRERFDDLGIGYDYEVAEVNRMITAGKDVDIAARQIVKSWLRNSKQSRIFFDEDLSDVGIVATTINGKTAVTLDAFGSRPWQQNEWQQNNERQQNDWQQNNSQQNNWQNNWKSNHKSYERDCE
jgi:uncharacterized protein YkwD